MAKSENDSKLKRTHKVNKLVLANGSSGDDENPWKNAGEVGRH